MNGLCRCRTLLLQTRWLFYRPLSTDSRKPLIHFPQRRGPDGKPIISLESFRQGSSHNSGQQSQSKLGDVLHQHKVDLPANYGRRIISEEEMDIINLGGAR